MHLYRRLIRVIRIGGGLGRGRDTYRRRRVMDKIIIRMFEKVMRSHTINYLSQISFNVLNSMYKCAYLYAYMLMMVFPPKENNLTKPQYQT